MVNSEQERRSEGLAYNVVARDWTGVARAKSKLSSVSINRYYSRREGRKKKLRKSAETLQCNHEVAVEYDQNGEKIPDSRRTR